MEQKYLERLLQIVRVLKELPVDANHKFDLGVWSTPVIKNDVECGTAACAIGWAGSDTWFRRRGFSTFHGFPIYNTISSQVSGWVAVTEFFGLSQREASYLFTHRNYVRGNRRDVYTRLEGAIKRLKAVLPVVPDGIRVYSG